MARLPLCGRGVRRVARQLAPDERIFQRQDQRRDACLQPRARMTRLRGATAPIAFTVFRNEHGFLTKRALFDASGRLCFEPAAQRVSLFETRHAAGVRELADAITSLDKSQAVGWGVEKTGRQQGRVVTKARIAVSEPDTVARSLDYFAWPAGPAVLMIDCGPQDATRAPARLARCEEHRASPQGVDRSGAAPGRSSHAWVAECVRVPPPNCRRRRTPMA